MNKYFSYISITLLLVSVDAFASQQLGRVFISYGTPIIYDAAASSSTYNYPQEIRSAIKSYSVHSAGESGRMSRLDINSVELTSSKYILRDGFIHNVNAIRKMPGMSDFSYNVLDTNTSGYPSVRIKYKGKFKATFVGGEMLYAYDVGSSSAWSVSVIYFWKDGIFSNYRSAAEQAASVINSVGIR